MGMGIRSCAPDVFRTVASALIQQTRLQICYHSRVENKKCSRVVSPQRLFHYRDNWYLAVFCHNRDALRTMSLERISEVTRMKTACQKVDEAELHDHFFSSFGIFAGQPTAEAVLLFSSKTARWVAEEIWHPDQKGRFLEDGSYELTIPYADKRELIMEILGYGPEVRVVAPETLRQEVCKRLRQTLYLYEKKPHTKK